MFHVYLIDHPLGAFTDAMVFPSADEHFNIAWVHPILVHFTVALFLLAVSGAGLTVTAAYWGGELVYRLGVSVRAIDDFALDSYQRKVDSALGRPPTLPRKAAVDDD